MTKSGAIVQSSGSGSRPVLKGHHAAFMKKHLAIAIIYSLACVAAVKFAVNEPRKRAYAEYYKYVQFKRSFMRYAEFNRCCSFLNSLQEL